MRGSALFLLLGLATAAIAAPETEADRFAIHFEHASSRMLAAELDRIARLKDRLDSEPDCRLVILLPHSRDPIRTRFLTARLSELDRSLRNKGLISEHRQAEDVPDEDGLWVVVVQPIRAVPEVPREVPIPTEISAPSPWIAESGRTLRDVLAEWGRQAGWSVVWQSSYDYPLEASARFDGEFSEAATKLLSGFGEAVPSPTARLFRANKVLLVQ